MQLWFILVYIQHYSMTASLWAQMIRHSARPLAVERAQVQPLGPWLDAIGGFTDAAKDACNAAANTVDELRDCSMAELEEFLQFNDTRIWKPLAKKKLLRHLGRADASGCAELAVRLGGLLQRRRLSARPPRPTASY